MGRKGGGGGTAGGGRSGGRNDVVFQPVVPKFLQRLADTAKSQEEQPARRPEHGRHSSKSRGDAAVTQADVDSLQEMGFNVVADTPQTAQTAQTAEKKQPSSSVRKQGELQRSGKRVASLLHGSHGKVAAPTISKAGKAGSRNERRRTIGKLGIRSDNHLSFKHGDDSDSSSDGN